jgi:hypothetical protein
MPREKTVLINGNDVAYTEAVALAKQGHITARLAVSHDETRKSKPDEKPSTGASGTTPTKKAKK